MATLDNHEQNERLVSYVEVVSHILPTVSSDTSLIKVWEEIAANLNIVTGDFMLEAKGWKEYWMNLKNLVKDKHFRFQNRIPTELGLLESSLTKTEERILEFVERDEQNAAFWKREDPGPIPDAKRRRLEMSASETFTPNVSTAKMEDSCTVPMPTIMSPLSSTTTESPYCVGVPDIHKSIIAVRSLFPQESEMLINEDDQDENVPMHLDDV